MKKCVNCGFESSDETINCPACSTDTFTSTSPDALGHIISPEEQRFWERMTFRQFAVFTIRLQALWLIFNAINYATYLTDYLTPFPHFTRYAWMIVFRAVLHLAMAIACIRYADRIVSWFVKDIVPNTPIKSGADKPVA
jgi:RNA polymerase subunit RPABC4/transcription elongation factor Spt4